MQALAGLVGKFGQILEANRCVDEVTKNKSSRIRFSTKKERGCFIKKRFGKVWITSNALDNGLFEITG